MGYVCSIGEKQNWEILMVETPKTTEHKRDAYLYLQNQASVMLRPYLKQLSCGVVEKPARSLTYAQRLFKKDAKVKS
jgi:hypothetical protein